MTIDELLALTGLTGSDEIPVWDAEASGEPTKKITAQNLANSVKSLAGLPNTAEMNAAIAQSTAIPFAYDGTPGTDPFEAGGSGVILNITAPNGTIIGHLVLRPKNYSTDIGKNRALELYNASWTPIWYIDKE